MHPWLTARTFLLSTFAFCATASAQVVMNPNFDDVPVRCSQGFAIEPYGIGNCSFPTPEQHFDAAPAIGWLFTPAKPSDDTPVTGVTNPNTAFNPPSFAGFPFTTAALLQRANSKIEQEIYGFAGGSSYDLSFYLGSRYNGSGSDGNQTVQVSVDDSVIGVISLSSFTPFTLHIIRFKVALGGAHILAFEGVNVGDHTAFVSGVSIARIIRDE